MMLLQPACLHLDSKLHHFPLLQIRIQYKNWNSHEITHKIYIDKQGKMISCQVAFEKEWYILSYDCLRVNTLKGFWSFIFEDFEFKLCLWTLPLKHNCAFETKFLLCKIWRWHIWEQDDRKVVWDSSVCLTKKTDFVFQLETKTRPNRMWTKVEK